MPGGGDDGQENTAVGVDAMAALTSGGENVALGVGALRSITHGARNCAIGYKALENNISGSNVAVGDRAGQGAAGDDGYNNTFLGAVAGPTVSGLNNATAIGANATVGTSASLALGGTGTDAVNVGIGTASPKKRLHVVDGDIYVDSATINAGIILRATDNPSVCKKITINAAGTVAVATITCP